LGRYTSLCDDTRTPPWRESHDVIPIPPRLVLFDLDGTLLDTLDDIALALGKSLAAMGRPPCEPGAVAKMVGDGARALVTRALGVSPFGEPTPAEVDAMLASFLAAYAADPTPATRYMPGTIELLDALERAHIRCAVCTNKPRAITVPVVGRMLAGRIAAIVAGGDTPRLKPDRGPIDRALTLLGSSPADAVMVGDGPQDIRAAQAAGVAAIGVRGGYGGTTRLEDASPDRVVDRLDALIELFEIGEFRRLLASKAPAD
jgi:phosphoglycolate phosphatase